MAVRDAHDHHRDTERDERGATILGIVLAIFLAIMVALSLYVRNGGPV